MKFQREILFLELIVLGYLASRISGIPAEKSSQDCKDANYWKALHHRVYADRDGEVLKPAQTLELLEDLARFYKGRNDKETLTRLEKVQALIAESKATSESCDFDTILRSEELISIHEYRPNILIFLQYYEGQRASKCLFSSQKFELENLNRSMSRMIGSMLIYYSNSGDQHENRIEQLQKLIEYSNDDGSDKCWRNSIIDLSQLIDQFSPYPTMLAYTAKLRCKIAFNCLDSVSQPEFPTTKEEEHLIASIGCTLDPNTQNFENTIQLLDPNTFTKMKCNSIEYKSMISALIQKYRRRSYAVDYIEDSRRRYEKFCNRTTSEGKKSSKET